MGTNGKRYADAEQRQKLRSDDGAVHFPLGRLFRLVN